MTERINWAALPDDDYVDQASKQIWLSAFATGNPRAPAHAEDQAAEKESERRGKPWLYQRAYYLALRRGGLAPTAEDGRRASLEYWQTATEQDQ